jgi:hypothetical protein
LTDESVNDIVSQVEFMQCFETSHLGQVKLGQKIVVEGEAMHCPQRSQCAIQLGDFVVAQGKLVKTLALQKLIFVQLKIIFYQLLNNIQT